MKRPDRRSRLHKKVEGHDVTGERAPAILKKGAVACAALIFALIAAEFLVRLTWPLTITSPPPRDLPRDAADLPRLKGVFALAQPNQLGVYNRVVHRTNSAGFRGREYSLRKPEDVLRMVVIGDSITMGAGVDEEETYSMQLERALNARPGDYRYEVLNFGIAGFNLKASVNSRLVSIGLRYDPDLIIYGFTLNDLEGHAYTRSKRGGLESPHLISSRSHLLKLIRLRWRYLQELVAPPAGSYVHELDFNYFDNQAAWDDFHDELAKLAGIAKERGICGIVFIHTRLHALSSLHPFRRHYRKVASAAERLGLFVIDPIVKFQGLSATSLWVHALDPHPNARAHGLLAEALLEGLQELPQRCRHRRTEAPAERGRAGTPESR